ncbi:MAG: guanylate kinase [Oscillibacter sp.]|jgi:guanylate kinase|nr:guanylate kinase [Oscillibacter sp.]MCI9481155.1 guanylate kinase [Oscillibacter sp.]
MRKGKTFVISGPSGVGKGTVLKALLEQRKNVYISVSATTRTARPGEEDGIHYHFLEKATFQEWIAQDAFLEYAKYVGNFYGTPKKFVDSAMDEGQDVILEIDVQGALQVAEKRPETILIFIAPPSWEALEQRLTLRGTDRPEKIQERLQRAKVEFQSADAYHYVVINDTVENAARELDAILTAEHCRVMERMEMIGT